MINISDLIKEDLIEINKTVSNTANAISLTKENQQIKIFIESCAVHTEPTIKEIWDTIPTEELSPTLNARILKFFKKECRTQSPQKDFFNINNAMSLAFRKSDEPLSSEDANKVTSALERARQKMKDKKK